MEVYEIDVDSIGTLDDIMKSLNNLTDKLRREEQELAPDEEGI